MNKFVQNLTLSDNGIKSKRAGILGTQAKTAQDKLVLTLRGEKEELDSKLTQLEDLAPDTSISLKPGGDHFDASAWVEAMQETKVALVNKKIELKIAEETLAEWFTAPVEEAAKA
ncbi:MAG TPA: hypothetical protein VGM30_24790 [Puia sp.]|jgi:hypothetical protein